MARIKPVLKLKDLEAEKNKIKNLFLNTELTDPHDKDNLCAVDMNSADDDEVSSEDSESEEVEYHNLIDPDLYFAQAMQCEANNELEEAIDFYSQAIESK